MARAIVIGVDGSDDAVAVATQAGSLAEQLGLRTVLAHVALDRPGFRHGMATEDERHAEKRRSAEVLARRHLAMSEAEQVVLFGEPAGALEQLAADVDAALIAVGSRGRGPLKSAVMGSVSLSLATRSALPVLVLPPGARSAERAAQRSPQAILCGIDDSGHADRVVQAAADIARALALRLVLVHAQRGPASLAMMPTAGVSAQIDHHAKLLERQQEAGVQTLERAERLVAGDDLEVVTRLEAGDPAGLLGELAAEEAAALIVVGSRGQGAVRAALHGSTSARLVGLASLPVLIVPPQARLALRRASAHGVA